jgi:hypothetical protein
MNCYKKYSHNVKKWMEQNLVSNDFSSMANYRSLPSQSVLNIKHQTFRAASLFQFVDQHVLFSPTTPSARFHFLENCKINTQTGKNET